MSEIIIRRTQRSSVLVTVALACFIAMTFTALAQSPEKTVNESAPHSHSHPAPKNEIAARTQLSVPDLEVLDQEGQTQKFYTDLVKDKVVVINFIFTTCDTICPMAGANFSKLQTLLGDRLGREVYLISVTTDPETDTPEKLKTWATQFKAKDGWTLVTGKKAEIEQLLRVLTGDGLNKGYHVPSIFIANDHKKAQRFAYGLDSPERLLKMVEEVNR